MAEAPSNGVPVTEAPQTSKGFLAQLSNLGNISNPIVLGYFLWQMLTVSLPKIHDDFRAELQAERRTFAVEMESQRKHDFQRHQELTAAITKNQFLMEQNQKQTAEILAELRRVRQPPGDE